MKTAQILSILITLVLVASGCRRPTQEDRDNRRLLDAILTTITIKNARLLDDNEQWAQSRHDAGQLTDGEFDSMTAIIAKARRGDWSRAEADGYAFRKKRPFVREGQ
ncbi:MAG TPA: hypothetical protein VGG64_16470 [Pirellulales bacterium]|jgi:hypothetical protein